MKVTRTGESQGVSGNKKAGGTQSSDGSFGEILAGQLSGPAATTTTQSIAQVDALLAIQGAEDPTQGAAKTRMRARSTKILDVLDNMRDSMLTGSLTVGQMINMADVVASHREKITDPALTAIMDEIDLRAQVELAKLKVVLDKKNT